MRRRLLLSTALVGWAAGARAALKDDVGNTSIVSPLTNLTTTFTGLSVNSSSNSITLTSVPNTATPSSAVPISFTYTGAAPSGLTALWNAGAIVGTVSGFTASGGSGGASVTAPASSATYTLQVTGTGSNTSVATAGNTTVVGTGPSGFPGQAGNPVGYAAAPGYPGSLTSASGTNITASASFKLFDTGTSQVGISGTNLTFTGCYFGVSTNADTGSQGWINYLSGGGHTFNFCTFGPSPSVVGGSFPPQPPGGGGYTNWPSQRGSTDSVGIPFAQGNQYGVTGNGSVVPPGGLSVQNCDIWGFSNGAALFSHTNASNPITVNNTWMHDPCLAPPGAHTDVLGDVQSATGDTVTHCTITNNTIAGVSSEGPAFQFENDITTNNVTITGNYVSCAASFMLYLAIVGISTPATNWVFSNNTITAVFTAQFGIIADGTFPTYAAPAFSVSGSGNKWRNNIILPGSYAQVGTVTSGTPFLWPDATANSSDWAGAF